MIDFSHTAKNMRSSEIRRLMKLAADPSIISFAGGMPSNDLFPIAVVDELYNGLDNKTKQIALQYGPTPGYPPLLEELKKYLISRGISLEGQELIITTGAQQALNLVAKVFINPGDCVVAEYPSFIGAIAAFKSYDAELLSVPLDRDGIDIDALKATMQANAARIKMLYLNPVFQNPAGITYSDERKKQLIEVLKNTPYCIIEDDPYSELYFDDADMQKCTPLKTMAPDLPICYIGTFAKIFGPGLRLGWLLGPKDIVDKCELAKQSMDACSSTFTQVLAYEYLSKGKLAPYLAWLRPIYKRRATLMLDALKANMPPGVTWTIPQGGFYVWVTMPSSINATDVLNKALAKGAAFVIGNAFDPQGVKNNTMRLAFSFTAEEKIAKGIAIIADAVRELV